MQELIEILICSVLTLTPCWAGPKHRHSHWRHGQAGEAYLVNPDSVGLTVAQPRVRLLNLQLQRKDRVPSARQTRLARAPLVLERP